MSRRLSICLVATLVFGLSVLAPGGAAGASLMNFRLSNQGTQSIGRVDLNILPPGAVVPPIVGTDGATGEPITGSPLALQGTSSGFDEDLFSVALGTKSDAQVLRLLFGQTQTVDSEGNVTFASTLGSDGKPTGLFGPGARMDFTLSVDSSLMSALRLQLPEAAGGLVLQNWPLADVSGNSSDDSVTPNMPVPTPTASQVPEPVSLGLWGGVVALLLLRNKVRRPWQARGRAS